jgi:predicted XRE-type DNA-binding protein
MKRYHGSSVWQADSDEPENGDDAPVRLDIRILVAFHLEQKRIKKDIPWCQQQWLTGGSGL